MKQYDFVVIGAGAAGMTAAKTAEGLGATVAVVDKKGRLGGDCTWQGCVPSKALIHEAQRIWSARQAALYHEREFTYDLVDTGAIMRRVREAISTIDQRETWDDFAGRGMSMYVGSPVFTTPQTIEVDGQIIWGKRFLIATGSSPVIPNISGLDSVSYFTNETIFECKVLPKSIVIVGGGPIGIEMASALNRIGCQVTLFEQNKRILPHDDAELTELLTHQLRNEGVTCLLDHCVTSVASSDEGIVITGMSSDGKQVQKIALALLIATGRSPNCQALGLDAIAVPCTKKGITVNDYLQTACSSVYAAGDVVGPYNFSHMAWGQAVTATRNALLPWLFRKKIMHERIWVTFAASELATIGYTEQEARCSYGDSILIHTMPYRSLDRAICEDVQFGKIKIITTSNGTIIGAHILGPSAGDLLYSIRLAISLKIPLQGLAHYIQAYPTFAEGIWHLSKRFYVQRIKQSYFGIIGKRLLAWYNSW